LIKGEMPKGEMPEGGVENKHVESKNDKNDAPVLVRMHAHCLMGDVFGSTGCECHATLEGSLRRIAEEGRGALIYLHQTSQGFSVEKAGERTALSFHRGRKLPSLLDSERQTQREIGIGAQILSDLNLHRIRLLTNRPKRVAALEGFGIEIVDQVPVELNGVRREKAEGRRAQPGR
jgi:3,4-dihydroxy 2-butanone 4-phosphate synthase/GTP cyclohydrolase II